MIHIPDVDARLTREFEVISTRTDDVLNTDISA